MVEIDGPVVRLELEGACGSCPSSTMTMKMGLERRLVQRIPEISEVVQSIPNGPELNVREREFASYNELCFSVGVRLIEACVCGVQSRAPLPSRRLRRCRRGFMPLSMRREPRADGERTVPWLGGVPAFARPVVRVSICVSIFVAEDSSAVHCCVSTWLMPLFRATSVSPGAEHRFGITFLYTAVARESGERWIQ